MTEPRRSTTRLPDYAIQKETNEEIWYCLPSKDMRSMKLRMKRDVRTSNLVNVGRTGVKERAALPLKISKEAYT